MDMDPVELLVLLIVAGVCGAVGQAITGYSLGGLLVSVGVGFVGAAIGVLIARAAKLPEFIMLKIGSVDFPVIWAIIGSVVFVAIVAFVRRSMVTTRA